MPGSDTAQHPDCHTLRGRAHQVRDETNAAFHAVEAAKRQLQLTQDRKRRVSAELSEVLKELGAAGIPTGIPASKISGLVGLVVSVAQGVLLVRKHDRLKEQLQSLVAEEIHRVRRVTDAEAKQQELRNLEMETGNRPGWTVSARLKISTDATSLARPLHPRQRPRLLHLRQPRRCPREILFHIFPGRLRQCQQPISV